MIYNGTTIESEEHLEELISNLTESSKALMRNMYFGVNNPIPENLSVVKKRVIDALDEKISEEIKAGFVFDNSVFSMSLEAQINWSNLLLIPNTAFPLSLKCKDETIYSLIYENREAFYGAAMTHKMTKLGEGTYKTGLINATQTKEELDTLVQTLGLSY
jgi:hypothetical protein